MKWIIVSENSLIRESIQIYLEGVAGISPKDITPKSFDDFMIDLNYPSKIDKKTKFIIEFYYFSKTRTPIQNLKDGILNDPFDCYISDLLATIFFDQRFFKGDENWFLKRAVFFSFFRSMNFFLNGDKPFLKYCQLPQDLEQFRKFCHPDSINSLSKVPKEELSKKMRKSLYPAFTSH